MSKVPDWIRARSKASWEELRIWEGESSPVLGGKLISLGAKLEMLGRKMERKIAADQKKAKRKRP